MEARYEVRRTMPLKRRRAERKMMKGRRLAMHWVACLMLLKMICPRLIRGLVAQLG
jgi:hypothetical protein